MGWVLGIDLGALNTRVAVLEDGQPTVLADRDGHRAVPSVVAVAEGARRLVGRPARRQAVANAANTGITARRGVLATTRGGSRRARWPRGAPPG